MSDGPAGKSVVRATAAFLEAAFLERIMRERPRSGRYVRRSIPCESHTAESRAGHFATGGKDNAACEHRPEDSENEIRDRGHRLRLKDESQPHRERHARHPRGDADKHKHFPMAPEDGFGAVFREFSGSGNHDAN